MKKIIAILFTTIMLLTISASIEKAQNTEISDLPTYFCWRDVDGIDYTTPIRDQSPAPTCEAYALVASLETIMQYQSEEIFEPDLSETHLYFYAGGTYEAGYVNLIDAANYLIDNGVPDEGCYPDPHRAYDYPFDSLVGWEDRAVKIQDWGWVDHDIDTVKNALMDHGPLVVCISFPVDFFYYRGGVYTPKWGKHGGGHVVALVGYDDQDECWILKNSWGTSWGEDGWFRLSYDADIFAQWYGEGTGIMYIDGVYGNFKPDVPNVQIVKPTFYHTYAFNKGFPTLIRKLPVPTAAARIFGNLEITITAENTNIVEFYVDEELIGTDDEAPFTCQLQSPRGYHTLKILASNGYNESIDIEDFFVFF